MFKRLGLLFKLQFDLMLFFIYVIFCLKQARCYGCLVNTWDTDGLVFSDPSISSHSAEYAPMFFHLFPDQKGRLWLNPTKRPHCLFRSFPIGIGSRIRLPEIQCTEHNFGWFFSVITMRQIGYIEWVHKRKAIVNHVLLLLPISWTSGDAKMIRLFI